MPHSSQDLAFEALADANRRAIVHQLRDGPLAVSEIAAGFCISRPAISQHLKVLTDAGLTAMETCGTRNLYRLSPDGIAALHAYTKELWDDALSAFETHIETTGGSSAMPLDIIEKTIVVPLSPKDAFETFTKDLARWWPLQSHSLSAGEKRLPKDVKIEEKKGGQIIETLPDGSTAAWARITEFEPGAHLALDWHVGRDEADATQVSLRFLPHPEGCEVRLTHGGWDALGAEATTTQASYTTGWDAVLGHCFAGACALKLKA